MVLDVGGIVVKQEEGGPLTSSRGLPVSELDESSHASSTMRERLLQSCGSCKAALAHAGMQGCRARGGSVFRLYFPAGFA